MSGEFVVETTGKVYLPAIGVMQAGGVPLLEFQRMVREQYSRVIKEAVVTVTPTFSVVLLGGVGSPGLYSIQPTTTLLETIAMAGGFTKDAKPEQLSLVRDGQTIPIDGQRALISGSGELAIRLQSGDRITIPTKRRTNWMSVYYTFQFLATAFILAKQVAK